MFFLLLSHVMGLLWYHRWPLSLHHRNYHTNTTVPLNATLELELNAINKRKGRVGVSCNHHDSWRLRKAATGGRRGCRSTRRLSIKNQNARRQFIGSHQRLVVVLIYVLRWRAGWQRLSSNGVAEYLYVNAISAVLKLLFNVIEFEIPAD